MVPAEKQRAVLTPPLLDGRLLRGQEQSARQTSEPANNLNISLTYTSHSKARVAFLGSILSLLYTSCIIKLQRNSLPANTKSSIMVGGERKKTLPTSSLVEFCLRGVFVGVFFVVFCWGVFCGVFFPPPLFCLFALKQRKLRSGLKAT